MDRGGNSVEITPDELKDWQHDLIRKVLRVTLDIEDEEQDPSYLFLPSIVEELVGNDRPDNLESVIVSLVSETRHRAPLHTLLDVWQRATYELRNVESIQNSHASQMITLLKEAKRLCVIHCGLPLMKRDKFENAQVETDTCAHLISWIDAKDELPLEFLTEFAIASIMQDLPNWIPEQRNSSGAIIEQLSLLEPRFPLSPTEQGRLWTLYDSNDMEVMYTRGVQLAYQFERTGSIEDIHTAIITFEQIVQSTPDDHPNRAGSVNALGSALQLRFEQTGSLEDLSRSIQMNEQAVQLAPDNHPNRAGYLTNLGSALQLRFAQTGSLEDLSHAIQMKEQAVQLTPHNPSRALYLNNLGTALQSRFERTGSLEDLSYTIQMKEQAVQLTPDDHPNRAGYIHNLGTALQSRFEQIGSSEDLSHAIQMNEQAVQLTPDNHPDHALYLTNLGNALWSRFQKTGSSEDLSRAIQMNEQAVQLTPYDHPGRALYLHNLGGALQWRFKQTKSSEDRDRVINAGEQAVKIHTTPPSVRIQMANSASGFLIDLHDWDRAKCLLTIAVELLPTISPRTLQQADQQYNISKFPGITSRAVSISLQCGDDPYSALQLLEIGRGILTNLQLEVRSDISVLKASHPDLAQQFDDMRDQLDRPQTDVMLSSQTKTESKSETRRQLFEEFGALLADIRQRNGFERFLLGPSEVELKALARWGPIVVFNVSEIRSDALLVENHRIHSIQLPLLTHTDMKKRAQHWLSNQGREVVDRDAIRLYPNTGLGMDLLEWLWNVAVAPVLTELGITTAPKDDSSRPRVWWVTSGLLSRLPIHASGYHSGGSTENALDRVISSYIPSLKSLGYARERFGNLSNDHHQTALFLSMTETPGQTNLPGTAEEVVKLSGLVPSSVTPIVLQGSNKHDMVDMLPELHICHFACHSESHPLDPSKSQLLLEDWQTHPLSVKDIVELKLEHLEFAYLSACSAADCKVEALLDESINLATAFHLAGFSSVVGTLWPIHDRWSVDVAVEVYRGMVNGESLDIGKSAAALNLAMRRLREEFKGGSIDVWAAYIHIGV